MRVSDAVLWIPGQDEFIPDSHVYVIGKPHSGDLTLVDAGLMGKGNYKLNALEREGVELKDIKRIVLTHTHLDHIGCLPEIRRALPWAELWVHEEEGRPLAEGDERAVYGMEMFRAMCQEQYGIAPGAFQVTPERMLEGGEVLGVGGTYWEVLHIPGHSPGSIALYDPEQCVLVAGDVLYADYAIGRFDLHGASGPELLRSLQRLQKIGRAHV